MLLRLALVELDALAEILGQLRTCAYRRSGYRGGQHCRTESGADALLFDDAWEADWRPHRLQVGKRVDRFGERDTLLGAADARVTGADRPARIADVAEQDRRAVRIGLRTLAAQLVQAVALAVTLVAEFHGKASGIEVRTALAVLVDEARVGELGTAFFIHIGQLAEGQEVHHGGKEVVRVGRAAGDVGDHFAQDLA